MNVVHSGDRFQIYSDALKTYDKLPVGSYEVVFIPMQGFSLFTHHDLNVNEKIYGDYKRKAEKILGAFDVMERNMGVILSGPKGVGKSMFARHLTEQANSLGLPLVIVKNYVEGVEDYIASIEQEVVVLFDEFEKMFKDSSEQNRMLSLLDGVDGGKKLFVVTCNEVNRLSNYMLNRPGRFHYHFEFMTPNKEEVREYMEDNLKEEFKGNIDKVAGLAEMANLTYDCLRAIVFELNRGYSVEETLSDLNITIEDDDNVVYDMIVTTNDGETYRENDIYIKFGRAREVTRWIEYRKYKRVAFSISFNSKDVFFDVGQNTITVPIENIHLHHDKDDVEELNGKNPELAEEFENLEVTSVVIEKRVIPYLTRYAF